MIVGIISSGRPHAVPLMEGHLQCLPTWYVGAGEEAAYRAAGASIVVEAGGLIAARNRALADAFETGQTSCQLSDDLTKVEILQADKKARPATLEEVIAQAAGYLSTNCRLVGAAPTANAFYASHKVKRTHFIVGDFFLAAPSSLRFDPQLRLKEDYDFTAQHLATYGEVARLDWLLLTFKHRRNPGGAVSYRTAELEQEAIAVLKSKWPGWIVDNPRRPNEVLFKAR